MGIIKNITVLRSNFIPETLLFRDDLIADINLKLDLGAGNILLHGDTGCGKTASVINAIKKRKDTIPIYINCVSCNTYAAITKKIIDDLNPSFRYNEKGKSIANLSDDLKEVLGIKRIERLVFVFDEVDKLINKDRDHQQILSVIVESTESNIILISNDTQAMKNLDSRIESRLSPEKRFVRQYFAGELLEILIDRAKMGLEESSYDIQALALICKWINQTSGDIREALNFLYEIAILAEKNRGRITSELFNSAKLRLGEIEFDEIFSNLPYHQKVIIAGIAKLSSQEFEKYAEHKALYSIYERTLKNENYDPVQYRQFERLLDKLNTRKLIEITTRSPKNRRGRLIVSFPKFDVDRFMRNYFSKYDNTNDIAHPGAEGAR